MVKTRIIPCLEYLTKPSQKLEIMDIYKSEVGDFPFPRSQKNIRALASLRACTVNLTEAEAFMSLKTII